MSTNNPTIGLEHAARVGGFGRSLCCEPSIIKCTACIVNDTVNPCRPSVQSGVVTIYRVGGTSFWLRGSSSKRMVMRSSDKAESYGRSVL